MGRDKPLVFGFIFMGEGLRGRLTDVLCVGSSHYYAQLEIVASTVGILEKWERGGAGWARGEGRGA